MRIFLPFLVFILIPLSLSAQASFVTKTGGVKIERMVSGLDEPWAISFLPGGGYLITERPGGLLLIKDGKKSVVSGVPRVYSKQQGGLLDVVVSRNFVKSREIFLSFAESRKGGAATALASAKLSATGKRLTDLKVIFRMNQAAQSGRHFGSRIVEARDGTLFLTIGDRGQRLTAQDLAVHNGKVIRVNRDGSIPSDNPFANSKTAPEIYSLGHRNPQGATLDITGQLWIVEHGAKGGDEINVPKSGKNYGWPVISFGVHYSGKKIGQGTSKKGLEQPAKFWDPSIAPSGMMIYSGKLFPEWKGNIFVGSLKFDMISRLIPNGNDAKEVERLFRDQFQRIRDVREAPDGSIWFLSVGEGAAYRVTPN